MPRTNNRLNALTVARLKTPGLSLDGGGLYLQIAPGGARSWVYRFMLQGRAREMGLGSLRDVGLAKARAKAAEARKLRAEGIDPIEHRRAREHGAVLAAARAMTFEKCASAYIEANKIAWRNAKHVRQWESTLRTYCYPVFGSVSVQDIDTGLVLKVLEPIWSKKTETASRLRGRMEAVLDWATARGYRAGENPARWRSHVENLLPSRAQVRRVRHHPALPYTQIGEFVEILREQSGIAALALEFLILTAARTSEVVGARWEEIDLAEAVWTIPPHRIKARREHRVPLAPRALAILKSLEPEHPQEFVFPGGKANSSLSNMALSGPSQTNGPSGHYCPRFPQHFPRLGRRAHQLSTGSPPKWRSPTRSVTKWKLPTAEAISSKNGASSQSSGLCSVRFTEKRKESIGPAHLRTSCPLVIVQKR